MLQFAVNFFFLEKLFDAAVSTDYFSHSQHLFAEHLWVTTYVYCYFFSKKTFSHATASVY